MDAAGDQKKGCRHGADKYFDEMDGLILQRIGAMHQTLQASLLPRLAGLWLAMSILLSAQPATGQLLVPHLGAMFSNIQSENHLQETGTMPRIGAMAGFGYEHILGKQGSLLASLSYQQKGFQYNVESAHAGASNSVNVTGEEWVRYHFLQLNTSVRVKLVASKKGDGLYLMAGGYLARGLSATHEWSLIFGELPSNQRRLADQRKLSYHQELPVREDTVRPQIKPWDAGLLAALGYEYRYVRMEIGYALGLADIDPGFDTTTRADISKRMVSGYFRILMPFRWKDIAGSESKQSTPIEFY
jgi:hypothetical protein